MSLVDIETGEIVDILDEEQARAVTNRIRQCVAVAHESIVHAYRGRAWIALGHESWDAYCDAEFGGARLPIPKADRSEVVALLRAEGMSTRAIGSALGISNGTVHADLSGVQNRTPDEIIGVDGRTYPAQQPERADVSNLDTDDRGAGEADPREQSVPEDAEPTAPVEVPTSPAPEPEWEEPSLDDELPPAPVAPQPPPVSAEEQREIDRLEGIDRRRKRLVQLHSSWPWFEGLRTSPDRAEVLRGMDEADRQFILDLERRVSWKA